MTWCLIPLSINNEVCNHSLPSHYSEANLSDLKRDMGKQLIIEGFFYIVLEEGFFGTSLM